MNKYVEEIPKRAYLNAQVVQAAERVDSWSDSINGLCDSYKLNNYQFRNAAYVVSLMYCLLVVPKELWIKKNKAHPVFESLKDSKSLELFDIINHSNNFYDNYPYSLLHKLRNSVAHVNYRIDSSFKFEFWDEYNEDMNFRARIRGEDLMEFISEFGSALANM